ncbi:MAG: NfeD family protein, partial [Terriglobales bacterium]
GSAPPPLRIPCLGRLASLSSAVFRPWRIQCCAAGLVLALALSACLFVARAQGPAPGGPIVVIDLHDTVNTVSAEYIGRGIRHANQIHASAVVLELSTPGGLGTAMHTIIQDILAAQAPVIGYVAPSGARSASAGFYILLSCDVAAMAPGTNTGAAHPVVLGGVKVGPIEARKMQNDAAAYIRSLASRRHRNVALAEKGVLDSLSFTDQEALHDSLIDLVAPDVPTLLADLNGRTITRINGVRETLSLTGPREPFTMSIRERVLDMNASLAFILLAVGALLIYMQFTHPAHFLPGVVGLILVVFALFALSLLPINWSGAGLVIVAFVLFALEIKFPTHGVLAVGGAVALGLGGLMLVNSPVPQMRVDLSSALGVAIGFGVISAILVQLVIRAQRRRVVTGSQGLLGEAGIALTALALQGTVLVHGERWHARARAPIAAGQPVRVLAVHGLRLEVEAVLD